MSIFFCCVVYLLKLCIYNVFMRATYSANLNVNLKILGGCTRYLQSLVCSADFHYICPYLLDSSRHILKYFQFPADL